MSLINVKRRTECISYPTLRFQDYVSVDVLSIKTKGMGTSIVIYGMVVLINVFGFGRYARQSNQTRDYVYKLVSGSVTFSASLIA
jgi:hypothetical protein